MPFDIQNEEWSVISIIVCAVCPHHNTIHYPLTTIHFLLVTDHWQLVTKEAA